jgi:hypothetical protein
MVKRFNNSENDNCYIIKPSVGVNGLLILADTCDVSFNSIKKINSYCTNRKSSDSNDVLLD